MYTFNTFGSCVVEEAINALTNKEEGHIVRKMRYARSAVLSCMAEPLPVDQSLISGRSKAARDMVFFDLNKSFFPLLTSNPSDFFAMDLVEDVTHPILLFGSPDKLATYTKQMKESGYLKGKRFSECLPWVFKEKYPDIFSAAYRRFFENLQTYYEENKIFLFETYMMDQYVSKDGTISLFSHEQQKIREACNQHLEALYADIVRLVPGINLIKMPDGTISDENHRYSLSAFHYKEASYNEAVCNEVLQIIQQDTSYVPLAVSIETYNALSPENMQSLQLYLHELATNRVSFGNESAQAGSIVMNCNPFRACPTDRRICQT